MQKLSKKNPTVYEADEDAEYDRVIEINLSELKTDSSIPTSTRKHKKLLMK